MARISLRPLAFLLLLGVAQAAPDAGRAAPLQGVTVLGEGRFRLSAAFIASALDDLAGLSREARIVPFVKDGHPQGFKLYGLRRSSRLGALGLRNGDAVLALDGIPLSSPESALQAYERLRRVDGVTLSVERRGERMTLTWQLEGPDRVPSKSLPLPAAPLRAESVPVTFGGPVVGEWAGGVGQPTRVHVVLQQATLDAVTLPRPEGPPLELGTLALGTVTLALGPAYIPSVRSAEHLALTEARAEGGDVELGAEASGGLKLRGDGERTEASLRVVLDLDLSKRLARDAALRAAIEARPSPFLRDGRLRVECQGGAAGARCTPVLPK